MTQDPLDLAREIIAELPRYQSEKAKENEFNCVTEENYGVDMNEQATIAQALITAVAALEFYADKNEWQVGAGGWELWDIDGNEDIGSRARACLAEIKKSLHYSHAGLDNHEP